MIKTEHNKRMTGTIHDRFINSMGKLDKELTDRFPGLRILSEKSQESEAHYFDVCDETTDRDLDRHITVRIANHDAFKSDPCDYYLFLNNYKNLLELKQEVIKIVSGFFKIEPEKRVIKRFSEWKTMKRIDGIRELVRDQYGKHAMKSTHTNGLIIINELEPHQLSYWLKQLL